MDPISIYFFALASILGIETTSIVSQKASVVINPEARTFEIRQEDLFSIMLSAADSITVVNELQQISKFQQGIKKRNADGFIVDEIVLSRNGEQLDATLKGRYTAPVALAKAGIHLDSLSNSSFSLMNFPEWNIRSSDAVLKENYWVWPANKTVTITMQPYKNIPDEYRPHRRNILPYWQSL